MTVNRVSSSVSPDSAKVVTAFDVDVGIFDAATDKPTQARIRLRDALITASLAYEKNISKKDITIKPLLLRKVARLPHSIRSSESNGQARKKSICRPLTSASTQANPSTPFSVGIG